MYKVYGSKTTAEGNLLVTRYIYTFKCKLSLQHLVANGFKFCLVRLLQFVSLLL